MDLEAAWVDLEARRRPKKKRRLLVLFLWGVLIVSLGVVGWGRYATPSHQAEVEQNIVAPQKNQRTAKKELHQPSNNKKDQNNTFTKDRVRTQNAPTPSQSEGRDFSQTDAKISGGEIQLPKKTNRANYILLKKQNHAMPNA
ncbi:MAG: hypothetical protein AAF573_04430, partial [Bacteroidota bacterium]